MSEQDHLFDDNEYFVEPSPEEAQQMSDRYWAAFNELKLLAVHEAGHAATAAHLKRCIKRVLVLGPNRSFAELEKRVATKETLHEDLVVALAGYYAGFKETGDETVANIHCGFDNELMRNLFQALSIAEEEQKVWMKNAHADSKALI